MDIEVKHTLIMQKRLSFPVRDRLTGQHSKPRIQRGQHLNALHFKGFVQIPKRTRCKSNFLSCHDFMKYSQKYAL